MESFEVDKYVDFSYRGVQYSESEQYKYPFVLTGIEAIKNVIKMYLFSYKGDYGRNVERGGPLISIIGKSLNQNGEDEVKAKIENALASYSNIIVHTVKVSRDLTAKLWKVTIVFSDTYNKYTDQINTVIKED